MKNFECCVKYSIRDRLNFIVGSSLGLNLWAVNIEIFYNFHERSTY